MAQGTTTYTYNAGNRLTLITDPSSNLTTNTYDNNGNLTVTNANGTVTTNTWTYENRLRTVTLATPTTTTFTYDGDGLRRQTVTAAGTTNFIWDGQDVLLETDVSNNTQVTYTQTPDIYGDMVSQRRSDTTSFYHHDALGSTLALTDANENITDTYRYHAFGKSLTSTGNTVNNLRFVGNLGYYNESALALQYLRARYYQPSTGRFISRDPVRTVASPYPYSANDPVNMVDPSGEKCWAWHVRRTWTERTVVRRQATDQRCEKDVGGRLMYGYWYRVDYRYDKKQEKRRRCIEWLPACGFPWYRHYFETKVETVDWWITPEWECIPDEPCKGWADGNTNLCHSCCLELGFKCTTKYEGDPKAIGKKNACRHATVACQMGCMNTNGTANPYSFFIGLL